MERALVINDATSSDIYAIATEIDKSIRIIGVNEAAKEWADWADAKLQGRGKLEDILKFLDTSFSVDGPKPLTRPLRAQIAQHMSKFGQQEQTEIANGEISKTTEKSVFSSFSNGPAIKAKNANIQIRRASTETNKRALLNYKGLAFRNDQTFSSMGFEVKNRRGVWDPDLGPSGGWRCPVGTRYGGQITDRFGRNCGWGVTRRLANAISDTGQRLEGRLDGRRERRVAKRNERMARRLTPDMPNVRGRRRSGVARAMARQTGTPATPQTGRGRRGIPERMDDFADTIDGGWGRRPRAERRAGATGRRTSRATSESPRTGLPERMDRAAREVLEGTFLENRRKRRRERRGTARNREGIPERMDRTATEVLEGTFLENRRRRRQAVTQQAQERPRVSSSGVVRRTQNGPKRPKRVVSLQPQNDSVSFTPERYEIDDLSGNEQDSIYSAVETWKQRAESWKDEADTVRNRIREIRADRDHARSVHLNQEQDEDIRKMAAVREYTAQMKLDLLSDWEDEILRRQGGGTRISEERNAMVGDYSPVSADIPVFLSVVNNPAERRARERAIEERVAAAKVEANDLVKKHGKDQSKLRELTAQAGQQFAGASTINRASDARGRGQIPMETRLDAIADMEAAKAKEKIFKQALDAAIREQGINPPSDEQIEAMGLRARREFEEAIDSRNRRLGDAMRQMYGETSSPWKNYEGLVDRIQDDVDNFDPYDDEDDGAREFHDAVTEDVQDFIRETYEIEWESPSGITFRTEVTAVDDMYDGDQRVIGKIFARHTNGTEYPAGYFERTLMPQQRQVSHDSMFVTPTGSMPRDLQENLRNSGFATVFNGHAITYLQSAGFRSSTVTAADDGPFVWPRLGFRTDRRQDIQDIRDEIDKQLVAYKRGKRSIISNDRDAEKIEFLLGTPDAQHQDFILALSNRDAADQVVRNFFRNTTGAFYEGELSYSGMPADPRTVK